MYCYSFSVIPLIFLKQRGKLIDFSQGKGSCQPQAWECHSVFHPRLVMTEGAAEEEVIIFCAAQCGVTSGRGPERRGGKQLTVPLLAAQRHRDPKQLTAEPLSLSSPSANVT